MKAGYVVETNVILDTNNCIVVSNYSIDNRVKNWPFNSKSIKEVKSFFDIGVWKIKQLKSK